MEDKVPINIDYLKERIASLNIKKSALALAIGVDRHTLRRWLNGSIRTIRRDNLKLLAKELQCSVEMLMADSYANEGLTSQGLRDASSLMAKGNLLRLLESTNDWTLLETLNRSVINANTPPAEACRLLNDIAIACWRQNKLEEAERSARLAISLSRENKVLDMELDGLVNLGTTYILREDFESGLDFLEEAIHLSEEHEEFDILGTALSNTGRCWWEYGDLAKALDFTNQAIEINQKHTPQIYLRRARIYRSKAQILTVLNQLVEAEDYLSQSLDMAHLGQTELAMELYHFYKSDILARQGNIEAAIESYELGRSGLERLKTGDELVLYEMGARVFRLASRFEDSHRILQQGRVAFPEYSKSAYGCLYLEECRLFRDEGSNDRARNSFAKAIHLWQSIEAEGWLIRARQEFPDF